MPTIAIDLSEVAPITAASAGLAKTIARARQTGRPQIVTQKGRPTAAIISIELLEELMQLRAAQAAPVEG